MNEQNVELEFLLSPTKCSRDDVATRLRKDIKDIPAAHISNPKTLEFQVHKKWPLLYIRNLIQRMENTRFSGKGRQSLMYKHYENS